MNRDDLAITLSVLSTVAALTGVAIGMQARNDVIASTRFNAALTGCQEAPEAYRRFFLKLVNSPAMPYEAYFPGEQTTFSRAKTELIDTLNGVALASADFDETVDAYTRAVHKFDAPVNLEFPGLKEFKFGRLSDLLQTNREINVLTSMPAKLQETCNDVLEGIRK